MSAEHHSPARPARGRPRSESARRAVLGAARALFVEGGYPAATIEAIAERSGVAKTTIYRGWPDRAALLVELLLLEAAKAAPLPTGRDPVRALETELRTVARAAGGLSGRLLQSLLGAAHHDRALRRALQQGLFAPRRQASANMIRRAQATGQLRKDLSPLVAVDLLFGPLFYRGFVRHERLTRAFVDQVFANALAGMAPRSRAKEDR